MGLDMYLYKDYYIGGSYAENKDEVIEFTVEKYKNKFYSFRLGDIDSVRCLAIQWRKAYAIDRWFRKHCGCNDDCHYIGYEQIRELYDTVCEVIEDHSRASYLLPNGSYDSWYWEDLEFTQKELSRLVSEIDNYGDFYLYYERSY